MAWRCSTAIFGILVLLGGHPRAVAADDNPAPTCTLEPGPIRTVTRIVDGETIILDDGKVVRLIGALAPRARDANAAQGAWPPETDAIKALSDLVLAKKIKLAFAGRRIDRYGRMLAHVFVDDHGRQSWVQGALLAKGFARAYGFAESFACSAELLAHEAEAREKRLGLWNNGVYRALPADRAGEVMKLHGKYVRVTGTVVSIGRTKSATYINFSNDWQTDFTARVDRQVLAANPAFDRALDGLTSKTVVVRGWVERRNGPMINIADPSQLEIPQPPGAPATVSDQSPLHPLLSVRAPGDPI